MLHHLRPALVLTAVMTIGTGLAYPLAITGIAQAVMPAQANGSLIAQEGRVIGSALLGQPFAQAKYLHPRPSATGYNAAASGAANLGPTSAALVTAVTERAAAYRSETGEEPPIDAVTTSASSLDPDVSPENARAQAQRIATARGAEVAQVQRLIADHTAGPWLGLYGQSRVNVLAFNLALDATLPLVP